MLNGKQDGSIMKPETYAMRSRKSFSLMMLPYRYLCTGRLTSLIPSVFLHIKVRNSGATQISCST